MDLDPGSVGVGAAVITTILGTIFGFILRYQHQQNQATKELLDQKEQRDTLDPPLPADRSGGYPADQSGGYSPVATPATICPAKPELKEIDGAVAKLEGIALRTVVLSERIERRLEGIESQIGRLSSIVNLRDKNGTPMCYSSRSDTELLRKMNETLGAAKMLIEQQSKMLEKALDR